VPAVTTALDTLASVLSEPGTVQGASLAAACRTLADWAHAEGKVGTALAFLQAAALARPDDAGISYAVGRMARRHGEPTRAESWLQHAIVLARRKEEWEMYTLVYAGLGNLYAERGNFPAGKRALTRALRTARRHSLHAREGETLHDLFAIAAETGRVREAERLAAAAVESYGKGHPRLPYLAHDLAFLWVERRMFGPALAVMEGLRPHIKGFPGRMMLFSAAARAAAGVGDRERFERAWVETEQEVPPVPYREAVAAALLNLALGAEMLGELDRARSMALRAADVAGRTREGKLRLAAEALEERAAAGKPRPAPAPLPERSRERSEKLADRFTGLLQVG
jgi:tetratricopeptide (TPR) repeat protein